MLPTGRVPRYRRYRGTRPATLVPRTTVLGTRLARLAPDSPSARPWLVFSYIVEKPHFSLRHLRTKYTEAESETRPRCTLPGYTSPVHCRHVLPGTPSPAWQCPGMALPPGRAGTAMTSTRPCRPRLGHVTGYDPSRPLASTYISRQSTKGNPLI